MLNWGHDEASCPQLCSASYSQLSSAARARGKIFLHAKAPRHEEEKKILEPRRHENRKKLKNHLITEVTEEFGGGLSAGQR